MDTPLISLVNERRGAYKKVVDLGFAINLAAYAGGLAGLIYGATLLLRTSGQTSGQITHDTHPNLALGLFVLVLTALTVLVLVSAARAILAAGRVGLRALREDSSSGS